jgi:hypothetical protein
MIRFNPVVSFEQLVRALDSIGTYSDNGSVNDRLRAYGGWLYKAEKLLRPVTSNDGVEAMLHSSRHRWIVQAAVSTGHFQPGATYSNVMGEQLGLEIEATLDRVSRLREEVRALHDRWSPAVGIAVVDTSFFMEHQHNIDVANFPAILGSKSGEVGVIIPVTVIEELERLKDRGQAGDRSDAREALRVVERWFPNAENASLIVSQRFFDEKRNTWFEVLFDDDLRTTVPEIGVVNDQTVVNVAATVGQLSGSPVQLVSHDVPQRLRARRVGIPAPDLADQRRDKLSKQKHGGTA